MKTLLSHIILAAVCCLSMLSCADEKILDNVAFGKTRTLTLKVSIPGGSQTYYRARNNNSNTRDSKNLDYNTLEQRSIGDIYVLAFDNNDKLVSLVTPLTLKGKDGDPERWLEGELPIAKGFGYLVVMANLSEQGLSAADFVGKYEGWKDIDIYRDLIYNYPSKGWDLNKRRLPMWGKTTSFDFESNNKLTLGCNLYRSVAKMGVQVDDACTDFTLQEVYVYNTNEKGYFAAPKEYINDDLNIQYENPFVPVCAQFKEPQKYILNDYTEDGTDIIHNKKFFNHIYVPEADNKPEGNGFKALKMVVGGYFSGAGGNPSQLQYYLINMEDDRNGTLSKKEPFDIIRNHSYLFNITKVHGGGSNTPDEALPHLDVKIEDWTEEYMHSIPGQYTLSTDKSIIMYENNEDLAPKDLDIWTDLDEGWTIETDSTCDWFTISQKVGVGDEKTKISIKPNDVNYSITRHGSFYIVAGNIKKEIRVVMPQPETANCYIVGEDQNGDGVKDVHEMIVTIKGNGLSGIYAEGPGSDFISLIPDNPKPTVDDVKNYVTLRPAKIGIIWETARGLISLLDYENSNREVNGNNTPGIPMVNLPAKENTIKYTVNLNASGAKIGNIKGGNALIGAFDQAGNVLWSWHIWVAPDLIDANGQIKEKNIEKWTLNDYDMLDRNLGALSNRPNENDVNGPNSIASMGLLYQWGRKDPFIGANYSKNPKTLHNNGLLDVVHYLEKCNVQSVNFENQSQAIKQSVQHPTLLNRTNHFNPSNIESEQNKKGMMHIPKIGEYLWGVKDGLNASVRNLGIKTIYDPSPVGFRVPPVDAFVFSLLHDIKEPIYKKGEQMPGVLPIGCTWNFFTGKYDGNSVSYHTPLYYVEADPVSGQPKPNAKLTLSLEGTIVNPTKNSDVDVTMYFIVYKALYMGDQILGREPFYSSQNKNWRFNLIYVPHYSKDKWGETIIKPTSPQYKNAYQWGNAYDYYSLTPTDPKMEWIYAGEYINDANYYGFYLNYDEANHEPVLKNTTRTGHYQTTAYSLEYPAQYYYALDPSERFTSWLPITAVYDPNKYTSGSVNLGQINIQTGKSVTVNSFIWSNSTIDKKNAYGKKTLLRPTAMFLHGTENNIEIKEDGTTRNITDGRHIHALDDTYIEAEPQYAGSVRCIRDREKIDWDINSLTSKTTIKSAKGSVTSITITSVNSTWHLAKPGAPWLRVSPDSGNPDKGLGSNIKLTLLKDVPAGTMTTLEFRIDNESKNRTVTVTVEN